MATTTKLELTQLLAARNKEIEQLRLALSIATRNAPSPTPARVEYLAARQRRVDRGAGTPSEFQIRCAAARELAMETGLVTRV